MSANSTEVGLRQASYQLALPEPRQCEAGLDGVAAPLRARDDTLRICMFSDNFHPEIGGIQDSIEALATELGRRGHRVDCLVPRYSAPDYRRAGLRQAEIDLGPTVRIHRRLSLPFPSSTNQTRVVVPAPWVGPRLALRGRPDIVHVHTFYGMGLEGLLAARSLRVPLVGTNHTAVRAFGPYIPVNMDRVVPFVRWFYGRCALVSAPSRSAFADLEEVTARRSWSVISNPIDTRRFVPVPLARRLALKAALGLQGATVTFAGRLAPEKNIDTIVRALALLGDGMPEVELVLAGHGSHEAALRRLATELGVGSRIRFLGTLGKPALAELLQASDVFVMMSPTETQSMATLQAMACGLPVVAAEAQALPEFVNETNGVLVGLMDHEALAAALRWLLGDPAMRARLGAGGLALARTMSTERIADAWERAYASVVRPEP